MRQSRRGFVSGAAALAAYAGLGGRLFGATRPKFGFDPSLCNIPAKFLNHPLFSGEPVCGVNFGFLAKRGYFLRDDVKAMPRQMRESGVNWCILNTHFCQETVHSRRIFLDAKYSSGEWELVEIAKRLRDEGIRVILKPCLTSLDGAWMGDVKFPTFGKQIEGVDTAERYWGEWFSSLREMLRYFGEFASREDMQAVLVGAEYTGTIGQTEEWLKTIDDFRRVYDGPVSYEFTRNYEPSGKGNETWTEWKDKIEFLKAVDFLSFSWYPRVRPYSGKVEDLGKAPVTTLDEMLAYLKPARDEFDRTVALYGNKPVLFTEIGQRSAHGCCALPYEAWADLPYDAEEQANYMEAVFRTFSDRPQWTGLCWWKWDETQKRKHFNPDPRKDAGFRIYGKPACDVLRKWSGRGV